MNTLPISLVRYRHALEDAIQRDLEGGRRRARAVRLVVAVAAASALAFGVLAIVSSRGPSGVQTASAASVIHRAAAALRETPGTILHVSMTAVQTNPDGSTVSWKDESWQQVDAPYARRQIETGSNGKTESANGADREEVYDASTDTIYVSAPETDASSARFQLPTYRLAAGRRPGAYIVRPKQRGRMALRALTISAAQAKALWKGIDVVIWAYRIGPGGGVAYVTPLVVPAASLPPRGSSDSGAADAPDPASPAFRTQILALLRSGGAHVVGHVTIDGRDTIEIASTDGHNVYYVDADTYAPVELDTTGTGGGVKLRFNVWEELPANGNSGLLSLFAQHPTATVNRDPSAYRAAERRLFPHG